MKYLITGFPGMGKSSIAAELTRRGYAAFDPEAMPDYMHLQSVQTGRPLTKPGRAPRGWFDTVADYNWDTVRLNALLDAHADIFICSLADNMELLLARFDKLFVLTLDDMLLEQRLRERTDKGPGNDPDQLADVLMLHRHFESSMINKGAIAIDVQPGIPAVVDTLLAICHER